MGGRRPWDRKMKWIFGIAPEDLVAWLLKDAEFIGLANTDLDEEELYSDILCEIKLHSEKAMLHIEFQKKRDSHMAERLWKYNVRATLKYKCPVWSCVIYLRPDSAVEAPLVKTLPNGRFIHRFDFDVIKMWEIPTRHFLQTGLKGLLPLLSLTSDGQRREVIETAIGLLMPPAEEPQRELLSLTYGFASLVFASEEDQNWLVWRFAMLYDILRETRAFQEMAKEGLLRGLEQGREQGMQQGIQQGIQQGMQQGREQGIQQGIEQERKETLKQLRQIAESLVVARFADAGLVEHARQHITSIDDAEALQQLILNLALTQTADEVQKLL